MVPPMKGYCGAGGGFLLVWPWRLGGFRSILDHGFGGGRGGAAGRAAAWSLKSDYLRVLGAYGLEQPGAEFGRASPRPARASSRLRRIRRGGRQAMLFP